MENLSCKRLKLTLASMDALSFRQREQLFHELAQFSRSGIALGQAFELLSRRSDSQIGNCLKNLKASLAASGNLGRALREAGFSESDAAVVQAGEASGRLDAVFLELGEFYGQLAQARRTIIAKSIYPLVVLHLAAILLAIPPALLGGGWSVFLAQSLPILGGFYAFLALGAILWRIIRSLLLHSPTLANKIVRLPLLGHFLLHWTVWKFASVLSLYIAAGGSLLRAFEMAGAACENAALKSAATSALSRIQLGESLSAAFRSEPAIPELLLRSIEVGEHAGRLAEESRRVAELYKNKTLQTLDTLAEWSPRVLYVCILVFTGWRIITMVTNLVQHVESTLEM